MLWAPAVVEIGWYVYGGEARTRNALIDRLGEGRPMVRNGSGMAQHEPVARIEDLCRNGWSGKCQVQTSSTRAPAARGRRVPSINTVEPADQALESGGENLAFWPRHSWSVKFSTLGTVLVL
jgi:hypothetical protein